MNDLVKAASMRALMRRPTGRAAIAGMRKRATQARNARTIDISPDFTRTAVGNANQVAALSRQVADLTQAVATLGRFVVQDAGEPVMPGRVAEGYSLYAQPDENGKGGIVWSPVATFGAADPAGTVETVEITGLDRARLTSTLIRAIQFVLGGDLEDLTEAAKVVCSLELNGLTNERLNRVPLDFAPGPGGVIVTTLPIPQGIYVPPDTFITLEFETETALTTSADGTVQARIIAGE